VALLVREALTALCQARNSSVPHALCIIAAAIAAAAAAAATLFASHLAWSRCGRRYAAIELMHTCVWLPFAAVTFGMVRAHPQLQYVPIW
jgi:hypothetical protein